MKLKSSSHIIPRAFDLQGFFFFPGQTKERALRVSEWKRLCDHRFLVLLRGWLAIGSPQCLPGMLQCPMLSLPPDGSRSTLMDQPAASVKGTFEHGSPNYRESAPCTVGARGFERERERSQTWCPLLTQTSGSRAVVLRCFHSVTHSSPQNRAALFNLLWWKRYRDKIT